MDEAHSTNGSDGTLIESADLVVLKSLPAFKSRVAEEGGQRLVYCEASNEAFDAEDEKILKSLLLGSAAYFTRFGNIDLDHMSVLAYRVPSIAGEPGFKNPRQFEIGKPLEVRDSPDGVLVKGLIYRGHDTADWWWKTRTTQDPPMEWYASVYVRPDKDKKRRVWSPTDRKHKSVLTAGEWAGLGFAREPVNRSLTPVRTTPFEAFLKGITAGLALPCCEECADGDAVCKALTAANADGTRTSDPATLTGGAALRRQSHGGVTATIPGAAARFVAALGSGSCAHTALKGTPTFQTLVDHFSGCEGMADTDARATARTLLAHVDELRNHPGERRAA